mmetsp:Transcript_31241/g.72857  ORF Transcript_31241/g.72857 Transcript_31241/m.72857 type:complete len:351 (+) Transcript_31241:133-1185(+)|eukprot:CAMPEP_0178388846 /NCGR_PEP_ID=MMETSP0689_2-20121128/9805_1 /TAXON_ID=160604 /ORGANISM="Amphidinium massartii, Strain CS-259" /LENGTH=350 /DNA_ID=CAMNT_0020009265 /DNA_START=14 /DNA_END=1066 /DNA_ORIENTATION=-
MASCWSCCGASRRWLGDLFQRRGDQKFYNCQETVSNLLTEEDAHETEAQQVLLNSFMTLKHKKTQQELLRFYTAQDIGDIVSFGDEFLGNAIAEDDLLPRRRSTGPSGPSTSWGKPMAGGGDRNTWADVDPTVFRVRGGDYLLDRKKVQNGFSVARLVVVDLLEVSADVPHVSSCPSIGTVQRVRAAGIRDQLLVLNFRICPLQLVVVWAVPQIGHISHPAEILLHNFLHNMSDEERSRRLKVIPRIAEGPWVAQKVVGSQPAILGKNIKLKYFEKPGELEVSIEVTSSGLGRRIVGVLQSAASAVVVDVAFVIEGQEQEELPEQLLGGFRVVRPDVETLRVVDLPDQAD